ncbi:MAG: hypothetical protein JW384_04076 [Nitrosomonadaceae bacterium]|nr:hypothetical protein [Nitrosomonadaceae bacterium]
MLSGAVQVTAMEVAEPAIEVATTLLTVGVITKVLGAETATRPLVSRVKSSIVYVPFAKVVVSMLKETAPAGGVHT